MTKPFVSPRPRPPRFVLFRASWRSLSTASPLLPRFLNGSPCARARAVRAQVRAALRDVGAGQEPGGWRLAHAERRPAAGGRVRGRTAALLRERDADGSDVALALVDADGGARLDHHALPLQGAAVVRDGARRRRRRQRGAAVAGRGAGRVPSLEARFELRTRGILGVADQWVLLNVNETDVASLCALVESDAVNGRCGHADAGGPVAVDLSGLSATEREALCAAQQEPAFDEACGRAVAPAAAYYFNIALTFGYLPVTLSAEARNALREALRADPSFSNVSAVSSAIGVEATSAWDAESHELPRSFHADFHDSVHRALLSSRAGEAHFERRLRAMEPTRFDELVAQAERAGVQLDGTDELTGRKRRKLTPDRFTNAIREAREEHVTCYVYEDPGRYTGTRLSTTESGATCS
eukprot:6205671-Pleurochrysis_carterae.AAC.1